MPALFDPRFIVVGMQLAVFVSNIYRLVPQVAVSARVKALIISAKCGASAVLWGLAVFCFRHFPISNWLFFFGSFIFFFSVPYTIKEKQALPERFPMAKVAGWYALTVAVVTYCLFTVSAIRQTHSISNAMHMMLNPGWLLILAVVVNMALWFLLNGFFSALLKRLPIKV